MALSDSTGTVATTTAAANSTFPQSRMINPSNFSTTRPNGPYRGTVDCDCGERAMMWKVSRFCTCHVML